MTGYGRGESYGAGYHITVEMRAVNHRYCETAIRLPKQYALFEDSIRQDILSKVKRGRVDVYFTFEEYESSHKQIFVDEELAQKYYHTLKDLAESCHFRDDLGVSLLTHIPDLVRIEDIGADPEELWPYLEEALLNALKELVVMREKEGNKLWEDIEGRLQYISNLIAQIETRAPKVVDEHAEKLQQRISDIASGVQIEENRLAMEVAFFADKSNITEEIVRFKSHVIQFYDTMKATDSIGRKLDFLVQEMNREINTIGSKANDLEITRNVVEVKSEMEKIREQVQNLE